MTVPPVIDGVYLSATLDLEEMFGAVFAAHGAQVRLRRPEMIEDPAAVRFALCWYPAADAFTPYPNLKLAASIAAGVDSLLACPSLPPDAAVTRVRDPDQAALMAGFAAWHVVWHHRTMGRYLDHQARAAWADHTMADLPRPSAVTVGVLGFGGMGQAVAHAVASLGFPVIAACSRPPSDAAGDDIRFEWGDGAITRTAAQSRILINVLPLTAETHTILNRDLFRQMPKGAVLIQIGRGAHLVDEDLDWALEQGYLAAASLDVFRQEPLPPDHPWWRDPRLLLTPHQASDSNLKLVASQVADAALAVVKGQRPLTAVDRSRGY